jgi:ABC-type branched-subunit amino acid transport system permease subunit
VRRPGWGPIVASVLVVVAGLWLALADHDLETAGPFGWLLVGLGLVFLVANLVLRRGRTPRRRP